MWRIPPASRVQRPGPQQGLIEQILFVCIGNRCVIEVATVLGVEVAPALQADLPLLVSSDKTLSRARTSSLRLVSCVDRTEKAQPFRLTLQKVRCSSLGRHQSGPHRHPLHSKRADDYRNTGLYPQGPRRPGQSPAETCRQNDCSACSSALADAGYGAAACLAQRQQLAADGGIGALRLGHCLLDIAPVVRVYGIAGYIGAIHRETGNDLPTLVAGC